MQFAHLHIARYIALQSDFERHFKSQSDFSRHLLVAASRILSAILDFRRHDQFAVYMAVGQGDLEFKRHFSRHRTLQFWTPDCRNSDCIARIAALGRTHMGANVHFIAPHFTGTYSEPGKQFALLGHSDFSLGCGTQCGPHAMLPGVCALRRIIPCRESRRRSS